jgi:hypothetical protein
MLMVAAFSLYLKNQFPSGPDEHVREFSARMRFVLTFLLCIGLSVRKLFVRFYLSS